MVYSNGAEPLYKLGQKCPIPGAPPHQRQMTTMYLSRDEYDHLCVRLRPAEAPLVKHRYPFRDGGHTFSVDVFQGPLEGLVMADLELADEALEPGARLEHIEFEVGDEPSRRLRPGAKVVRCPPNPRCPPSCSTWRRCRRWPGWNS